MQLYFIRHGQSENNARWERIQSEEWRSPDPVLTKLGMQQAEAVAQFLRQSDPDAPVDHRDLGNRAGFDITHIYTSLQHRAVATSEVIAKSMELPVYVWEDLHEWGGIYEIDEERNTGIGLPGKDRAFFETHYPNLVLPESFNDAGWWNRPYEEWGKVPDRANRVLRDLLENHNGTGDHVVFVSHGGFYNYFLAAVLHISRQPILENDEKQLWFVLNNVGITRIDFHQDYIAMVYLNRIDFLPDELIS